MLPEAAALHKIWPKSAHSIVSRSQSQSWWHLSEILVTCSEQHKISICDTQLGPAKKPRIASERETRASNHDPSHHNLLSQRKDSTCKSLEGLRWVKPHKMPPHPVNALSPFHENTRNELSNSKHDTYDSCESQALWFPFSCFSTHGVWRKLGYICCVIISPWSVRQRLANDKELT